MKAAGFCLALLIPAALPCGAKTEPPAPLWTRALTWPDSEPLADTRIVSMTPEMVTIKHGAGEFVALDTKTGAERWRLNCRNVDEAAPALQPLLREAAAFPVRLPYGVITRVDTDDDGVGHSQWPKYLLCSYFDTQGRHDWRFPAELIYTNGMGRPDMMMKQAIAIGDADVCLAVDEADSIYGLRARDGTLLWKQSRSHYQLEAQAVWKQGCFGFASAYWTAAKWKDRIAGGLTTIAYLSAQTGKVRPVLALPFVRHVFVGGDTLYAQTAPATFRAYSIPSLVASPSVPAPPQRKTQQMRRKSAADRASI